MFRGSSRPLQTCVFSASSEVEILNFAGKTDAKFFRGEVNSEESINYDVLDSLRRVRVLIEYSVEGADVTLVGLIVIV
jgi:hypothetical protein